MPLEQGARLRMDSLGQVEWDSGHPQNLRVMEPMMLNRREALILGTFTLGGLSTGKYLSADAIPGTDALDALAREYIKNGKAAGLGVGVCRNGKVTLCRAYGYADVATQKPLDIHSVFRIASVTKTFTAIAILQLKNQGKISLTDPLSRFLPRFPRSGEVTVRQLMSHTAGVHDYVFGGLPPGTSRHWTSTAEFVTRLAKVDPLYDFDPGTRFAYSNSGYILLGAVIEEASGQTYESFLSEHIFEPLGMSDTAVDHTGDSVPDRALGYGLKGNQPGQFVQVNDDGMLPFSAGAIRSSLADLLRWQQAFFAGKLLPMADVILMSTPSKTTDGKLVDDARWFPRGVNPKRPDFLTSDNYGLGLEIAAAYGHKSIGHDGGISGYNSIVEHFPEDDSDLILLANTNNGVVDLWMKIIDSMGHSN